ncbi:DEAD/DEAH box helicase [Cellulomonas fengjieae]|uniref:DEAD/DEAH box helicase n=1 Tax=Cellulomonas fengjieae TaxID=2819978 RepID=A0ABS3SGW7_9CELL|nr:DEAD/DEAH box helicase [Cellulomonas fengjieae]MBO3084749.1 DEAD/DEAH box helicase [Cellulomonas fengjieae]QVI66931.1 DEAD/DEAH box helicase [Cellulomonas fengjieae]
MGFIDRIRRNKSAAPDDDFSPMPGFRVDFGEETRFIADVEALTLMRAGRAQRTAQEQYYVLDALADDGRGTAHADGFTLSAEEICRLDTSDAAVLNLPPRYTGKISTTVHHWTASKGFRVEVELYAGAYPAPVQRRGPAVRVGAQVYRASVPLLRTLHALETHAALPADARTEARNVGLVAELQTAQQLAASDDPEVRDGDFRLRLGGLDSFRTVTPTSVGLLVEPQPDGSLHVEPDLGPDVDRELIRKRWQQLDTSAGSAQTGGDGPDSAVLRAEHDLVLLEPHVIDGIREVRSRPHIPAGEVRQFLEAPGSYYDPGTVDVDIRFGVRVAGLGVIAPVTFTEAQTSGLAWFGEIGAVSPPEALAGVAQTPREQTRVEQDVTHAWDRGEAVLTVGEQVVDIADRSRVQEALTESRRRIEALTVDDEAGDPLQEPVPSDRQVTVGMHIRDAGNVADRLRAQAREARPRVPVDLASLRRRPYAHQIAGIEWMAGLMQAAHGSPAGDPGTIQGALLADDMGLGKTFMVLVALADSQRAQTASGQQPQPVLGVMPVALLENWLQEIEATFGTRNGPFADIVVLQGSGLADYRLRGATRETAASLDDLDEHGMVRADRIHASLRVGAEWGEARLDRPGVLVLTTYETLRRYQVSLGLVDWGVVILDEAQATKNPEILATRAAKALKARFKLLATGTPVENSLRDFWSLVDTAQPGLLGAWAQFEEDWVTPMQGATGEEHQRLGRALRDAVGDFMLRRIKEDHLTDLPPKHIHRYPQLMPSIQVDAYDEVLTDYRAEKGGAGAALRTLHALSDVSLHPGLRFGALDADPALVRHSARTLVTVRDVLDGVRDSGEKAIIFAKRKELQRALRLWLGQLYGLPIEVVNGDTAATGLGETRMHKIRQFEAREGFNVIIMSPLAVGVGLTVVGANHAIHLERHWNPAKEAQATDRIHRIGQRREVHVHYPIALHPGVRSFDENLDELLERKVALRDAVVVPQEVTQEELERVLGLV